MNYVGIDMSKASFHAALDDRIIKKCINSEDGLKAFKRHLETKGSLPTATTIGVESTGVYHHLFARRMTDWGYAVMIIRPLESHFFAKAQSLRKLKSDAVDASVVRTMTSIGRGRLFIEREGALKMKALVTEREGLVTLLRIMKSHQEARQVRSLTFATPIYDPSVSVMAAVKMEISKVEKELKTIEPDVQKLLQSIPGIGPICAAALVAYVGDIHRFSTPEKLVAYIGLDCRVHQSGTSVNGNGYLSKRGVSRLRALLFNAAYVARQNEPALSLPRPWRRSGPVRL